MGKVSFLTLVDALAHKYGFRPAEWTEDDKKTGTSEWRNGGNWNECIMNKTSLRQQASLSESDIKFILSTEKCAE